MRVCLSLLRGYASRLNMRIRSLITFNNDKTSCVASPPLV